MDGVLFLLCCCDVLVPYKKRGMDSSGDLWRKGQVTPGDHLEGVGGEKKLFYTLVGQRRDV